MRWMALLLLTLVLLSMPGAVLAAETEPPASLLLAEGPLGDIDLSRIEESVRELNNEIDAAIPDVDFKSLVLSFVRGEIGYRPVDILNSLLRYLFNEVVANAALLGKLVVLAVIAAVLQNISSAFDQSTTSRMAHVAVYLVLLTLVFGSFIAVLQTAREAVENMVVFMHAMLPVMITLLCTVGGFTSAALLHPVIIIVLNASANLVQNIVLPLILFSAILGAVSHLASGFSLSRLADFFRNIGLGIMGLLTTIFLGMMAIQGVAGAVAGGVAFRTAKYATGAFVPVVGKMFADAMEAVIGSSLLIKNAVGMAGLLVIFLMAIFPLLKIVSLLLIYKLAAALVQPIGEKQVSDCLNTLGNSMVAVFAVVATCALLFFFALAIIAGMGNLNVMLH
jgi:stage III sporulation protein AE